MTAASFMSVKLDLDNQFEYGNTLSIEARERWTNDRNVAVVHVDTNYKESRESDYPVSLSQKDAVGAATALLRATLAAVNDSTDVDATALLDALLELDTEVHTLRTVLQRELQSQASEED